MRLRKLVHNVAHEHARLPHAAVSHDGALDRLRGQTVDVGTDGREACSVLGIQGVAASWSDRRSDAVHAGDGWRRALQLKVDAGSAPGNVADGRHLGSGGRRGR